MNLIINAIEETDYEKFVEWWKFWRFPAPAKNLLPANSLGGLKLTNEDGTDVAVAFLYETNSDIAWLEFLVLNPAIKDKAQREDAKKEIIYYITLLAEQKGYKAVFSSVKQKSLIDSFITNGYSESKQDTKELVINLNT